MSTLNTPVSGTLTSAVPGSVFIPRVSDRATNVGKFNVTVSGVFVATVRLERSPDGGVTWVPITVQTSVGGATAVTQLYTWSAPGVDAVEENVPGAQYRLNCTSYTSGTISYYIG